MSGTRLGSGPVPLNAGPKLISTKRPAVDYRLLFFFLVILATFAGIGARLYYLRALADQIPSLQSRGSLSSRSLANLRTPSVAESAAGSKRPALEGTDGREY